MYIVSTTPDPVLAGHVSDTCDTFETGCECRFRNVAVRSLCWLVAVNHSHHLYHDFSLKWNPMCPRVCRHRKVENKSGVSTFDLHDFMAGLVHAAHHRYAAENPLQVRGHTHVQSPPGRLIHVGTCPGRQLRSRVQAAASQVLEGERGRLSEALWEVRMCGNVVWMRRGLF